MLPFTREQEPIIPAAPYCRIACRQESAKCRHDGTHGFSPGTEGSNPAPSSGESDANLTSSIMVGADARQQTFSFPRGHAFSGHTESKNPVEFRPWSYEFDGKSKCEAM